MRGPPGRKNCSPFMVKLPPPQTPCRLEPAPLEPWVSPLPRLCLGPVQGAGEDGVSNLVKFRDAAVEVQLEGTPGRRRLEPAAPPTQPPVKLGTAPWTSRPPSRIGTCLLGPLGHQSQDAGGEPGWAFPRTQDRAAEWGRARPPRTQPGRRSQMSAPQSSLRKRIQRQIRGSCGEPWGCPAADALFWVGRQQEPQGWGCFPFLVSAFSVF